MVGVPRSGTTLLRLMLDAHPELAIPPETGFLIQISAGARQRPLGCRAVADAITGFSTWPDFGMTREELEGALARVEPFSAADGVRAFYRLYASRFGKLRAGDKTPLYGQHLPDLAALLPEARFIHIIRDGRDVAVSLRDRWFAPGRDLETLARYWMDMITTTRRQAAAGANYLEVRFEELVLDTRRVLEGICAFVNLPYSSSMEVHHLNAARRLDELQERRNPDGSILISRDQRRHQQRHAMTPPDPRRLGLWRVEMTRDERRAFESIAGPLLASEGYETGKAE